MMSYLFNWINYLSKVLFIGERERESRRGRSCSNCSICVIIIQLIPGVVGNGPSLMCNSQLYIELYCN